MFGAFNIFSVSVFDNIMSRPSDGTQTDNTASHLNEIYPDLRNDRAVLNVELPEKTAVPPTYSKVNMNKVRTFGAYPTVENGNYTDRLYVAPDKLKANIDDYRSLKGYM